MEAMAMILPWCSQMLVFQSWTWHLKRSSSHMQTLEREAQPSDERRKMPLVAL